MNIQQRLKDSSLLLFSLYAAGCAFSLYTCVYAFRKAFAVATFDGILFLGISYKVWLIVAQVLGYAISKFIGIRVISELNPRDRKKNLFLLLFIAGLALLLFPLIPTPYNIILLFINGLPLGLIWGIIFSYLEGRRSTEFLGAGLSVSFIFSTGFVKSVGATVMQQWGVSEWWMPCLTAALFVPPLILFIWLLDQLPAPSLEDVQMRSKRIPMNRLQRNHFMSTFGPGLVLLILVYVLLTSYREFRDNFSAEIWKSLGLGNSPELFTYTEVPISITVLFLIGSIMFVQKNHVALLLNHALVLFGLLLVGVSTWLFQISWINPVTWMILVGLGLYLGYVPFNSILFDRLLATFQYSGTVGFAMYLADSFGYIGSVGVLFFKEFGFKNLSWLNFFIHSGYAIASTGGILTLLSLFYFQRKYERSQLSASTSISSGIVSIK
jgi:MFS family permease